MGTDGRTERGEEEERRGEEEKRHLSTSQAD